MLYVIVWTAYEFSKAQGTSTSAILQPRRPSRTIHTRGHFDQSKTGGVDDVEPISWIYTSTHVPLTKQEDEATRDTQEAILAEAIRAMPTIPLWGITKSISKRINTLKGYE